MRRASIVAALLLLCTAQAGATDYATFHYDNARDGWNDREVTLDHATVPHLERYGDYALDGEVDAQPLYLENEFVPSEGKRDDVAYVATENDSVYAISPSRGIVWTRNFGAPVTTDRVGNCKATFPTIGIQGTPVIDRATDSLYFVAFTLTNGTPRYTLHAISASSGAEKYSRDISALVGKTSAHRQRAGLLESSGNIYVAFAGFCDHQVDVSDGRILAFRARDLRPAAGFVTTASPACGNVRLGTIWGLGFAPAADERGNVYFSTGNGCIDYSRTRNGGYSDAVLRLTSALELTSTTTALFAPCTAVEDNKHDQEMGSGGVVLPASTRFAIAGGKTGTTYVLDRERLGGYRPRCPDRAVFEAATNWGIWGGPIAWQGGSLTYLIVPGTGPHGVREYTLDRTTGVLTLRSQTGIPLINGGESGVVTSHGRDASTAVLWLLTRPTTGAIHLEAYDARDLSKRMISVEAGSWGNPLGYAGVSPTVADGFVFVATNRRFTVWGRARTSPAMNWLPLELALLAIAGIAAAIYVTRASPRT